MEGAISAFYRTFLEKDVVAIKKKYLVFSFLVRSSVSYQSCEGFIVIYFLLTFFVAL